MKQKIILVRTESAKLDIDELAIENSHNTKERIIRIEDESEHTETHSFTQYTGYNELGEKVTSFQNCPVVIKYETSEKK